MKTIIRLLLAAVCFLAFSMVIADDETPPPKKTVTQKLIEERQKKKQAYQWVRDEKQLRLAAEQRAAELENAKAEAERKLAAVEASTPVPLSTPEEHRLHFNLALSGFTVGAGTAALSAAYQLSFIDQRLALEAFVGAIYVATPERLSIVNIDPVARAYYGAALSYMLYERRWFGFGADLNYQRISSLASDSLATQLIGPGLRLKFGILQVGFDLLDASGPANSYILPGWHSRILASINVLNF